MHHIKLSPYHKIFYNEWKVNPSSYQYNIVFDQTFDKNLDVPRLKNALRRFTLDHLLFNSHISEENNEIYWIKNTVINDLEYFDSDCCKPPYLYHYVANPFSLNSQPLYRFAVFKTQTQEYRFIIVLHHILIDGNSFEEFITAVSKYYNDPCYQASLNEEAQKKVLNTSIEKLDHIVIENAAVHKQFWNDLLSDVEPVDLRFLRSNIINHLAYPENTQHNPVKTIKFTFPDRDMSCLNNICNKYKITPYFYSQCIFALLLYRYTNQNKFAVNYPVSINKPHHSLIFGAQINTIPMTYDFSKITILADLFNEIISFNEKLKNNHAAYCPIFNILAGNNKNLLSIFFAKTNFKKNRFNFDGTQTLNIMYDFNVDLPAIIAIEQENNECQISYQIRYNSDNVDETILNYFLNHYKKLLHSSLDDLNKDILHKPIQSYVFLDEAEYNKIVYEWNRTYQPYPDNTTLSKLFEAQVQKNPNSLAVIHENTQLTYNELNIRVNQLAHYLRSACQIQPDDLVAIYLARDEQLIISILATLKCGAAYIPMSSNNPVYRLKSILDDSKAKIFITNKTLAKNNPTKDSEINPIVIILDELEIQNKLTSYPNTNPTNSTLANNLAYVIYTSGTTGKPKGVMIEHRSIINYIFYLINEHQINNTTVGSQYADCAFDASMIEIYPILLSGGQLFIVPEKYKLEPLKINEFFILNKVSYAFLPPQIAQIFFNLNNDTLKTLITGGDKLYNFAIQNYKVINAYGLTETTVQSNGFVVNKFYNNIPIGKPIANTTNYVLDKHGNPLPIGAIGELFIGGEGIARGYLNNPELTTTKFIPNHFSQTQSKDRFKNNILYKTGDLVRYLPDGNLEYIQRNDCQIKIRGYRIDTCEIEFVLRNMPEIKQAVVLVVDDYRKVNDHQQQTSPISSPTFGTMNNLFEMASKKTVEQSLPLLPIQTWFFAQNFPNINHWNQSFLIKTPQLDKNVLKKSIAQLITFHDTLRIKYKRITNEPYPLYNPIYENNALNTIQMMELDIRTIAYKEDTSEFRDRLFHIFTTWQSDFNLEQGNLYKFGYVYGFSDGTARIYCALHHLIIDVVSWHIILHDLQKAYINIKMKNAAAHNNSLGEVIRKKYTSYSEWINLVNAYSVTHMDEKSYWLDVLSEYEQFNHYVNKLDVKNSDLNNNHENQPSAKFSLNLDVKHTDYLMTKNQLTSTNKVHKILLAVMASALKKLFVHLLPTKDTPNSVYITLEGHGREHISTGLDTSHTMGWFTTMFPVKLKVKNHNLMQMLTDVKLSLKNIPNHGIGYGALFGYTEVLPNISFNYLGQINAIQTDEQWSITNEDSGLNIGYTNKPYNLIEVNSWISKGELYVTITGRLEAAKLNLFRNLFETTLNEFISIIQAKQPTLASNEEKKYINTPTLVAYYVSDKKLETTQLKSYLSLYLPQYSIPPVFVRLDEIPLTSNGKIDTKAFPHPLKDSSMHRQASNEKEKLICEAFSKILGVKIGIDDDFFVCGGDSILAIKLVMQLQHHLDINVRDIYTYTTPHDLAQELNFSNNSIKNKLLEVLHDYEQPAPKAYYEEVVLHNVNDYSENIASLVPDFSFKSIENVLLTGATGYLGCNLLYQLINYTKYNIYLFVRAPSEREALARINHKYKLYFNTILDSDTLNHRIFILCADLERENFGLSQTLLDKLTKTIDSVIHAAASVKQVGEEDMFYRANVKATVNLLEFVKYTRLKEFHYISTISLLNHNEESLKKWGNYYTEDHQPNHLKPFFNNLYLKTKLEAENQVIAYRKYGVNTNIYRVGTLAFMLKNFTVQENIKDTIFSCWMRYLLQSSCILENSQLNLSPVDLTAEAIVKLFDKKCADCQIYHVFNPHSFNFSNYIYNHSVSPINILSLPEFINHIIAELENKGNTDLICKFLLAQGWMGIDGTHQFAQKIYLENRTQHILKHLGFKWPSITLDQFKKFVAHVC